MSSSLSIDGCIRASKMASRQIKSPSRLIHPSDRGVQYCSKVYVEIMREHGVKISMTKQGYVYEDALQWYIKGRVMPWRYFTVGACCQGISPRVCKSSNQQRLHMSLNYQTSTSTYETE